MPVLRQWRGRRAVFSTIGLQRFYTRGQLSEYATQIDVLSNEPIDQLAPVGCEPSCRAVVICAASLCPTVWTGQAALYNHDRLAGLRADDHASRCAAAAHRDRRSSSLASRASSRKTLASRTATRCSAAVPGSAILREKGSLPPHLLGDFRLMRRRRLERLKRDRDVLCQCFGSCKDSLSHF